METLENRAKDEELFANSICINSDKTSELVLSMVDAWDLLSAEKASVVAKVLRNFLTKKEFMLRYIVSINNAPQTPSSGQSAAEALGGMDVIHKGANGAKEFSAYIKESAPFKGDWDFNEKALERHISNLTSREDRITFFGEFIMRYNNYIGLVMKNTSLGKEAIKLIEKSDLPTITPNGKEYIQ